MLLSHDDLDKLHTTELGKIRIKKNLSLETDDVIKWCRDCMNNPQAIIERKGKNIYVFVNDYVLTINAHSFTLITAHIRK